MIIFVILILIILLFLNKVFFESAIFSPIVLHILSWYLPFVLLPISLSTSYYSGFSFSINFYIVFFLSSFSFVLGTLFLGSVKRPKYRTSSVKKTKLFLLLGVGIISFAHNIYDVFVHGGLSLYANSGLRQVEIIFGSNVFFNYGYFLLVPGMLYLVFGRRLEVVRRPRYIILISLIMVMLVLHGVKSTFMYPFVMMILGLNILGMRLKPQHVALTTLLFFMVFQLVAATRELPYLLAGNTSVIEYVQGTFKKPALYFSSGLINLGYELQKNHIYGLGVYTFSSFTRMLNFLQTGSNELVIKQSQLHLFYGGYNTGTYLRSLYKDFGFFGVIIFPFLYGVGAKVCYSRMHKGSFESFLTYLVVSSMIVAMFFSNHFLKIQYIYWIIVGIIVSRYSLLKWRR